MAPGRGGGRRTDGVNSVTFVGGAQTLIEKAVPKVGATVVAAHLALLAETHMALVAGVEARAICVPPARNWVNQQSC